VYYVVEDSNNPLPKLKKEELGTQQTCRVWFGPRRARGLK
jgi:hypothetical protein